MLVTYFMFFIWTAVESNGPCVCKKDLTFSHGSCDPTGEMKDLIRDDKCDDITNTAECFFDGGDCCRPTSFKGAPYCLQCKCHEAIAPKDAPTTPLGLTAKEIYKHDPKRYLQDPFTEYDLYEDMDYDSNLDNYKSSLHNSSLIKNIFKVFDQDRVRYHQNWWWNKKWVMFFVCLLCDKNWSLCWPPA